MTGTAKREFYVETPLGKLHVWAKQERDCADNFPGVYIDYIAPDGNEAILSCVEYESNDELIQTCVYEVHDDAPRVLFRHSINENYDNDYCV